MTLAEIATRAKLDPKNVAAAFPYGSRVYGTFRLGSDYDFIVVTKKPNPTPQFSDRLININFYTDDEHQQRINDHEISALECIFLNEPIYVSKRYKFTLDLKKLRHSLSAKSSNSFVKAKKKLTIEKDYDLDLGRKSLFHAFRIIDFGIQIAKTKQINNYRSCNALFNEIMGYNDWNDLFEVFKPRYNKICSEFRIEAPLD